MFEDMGKPYNNCQPTVSAVYNDKKKHNIIWLLVEGGH